MWKRITTSLIGLPAMIYIVNQGGLLLRFAVLALAIIGMYEFYNVMAKKSLPVHYAAYATAVIYIWGLPYLSDRFFMIMISLFIVSLCLILIFFHETINIIDCSVAFMGFFYVAFLMSFIYMVRSYEDGIYFVWLIFISAWGSDTFAYFTGITIGKHQLCPKLSPKKTVEGSLGGIIGATLLAMLYGYVLSKFVKIDGIQLILFFGIIAACGAVFPQCGDLAASAIKRYTGAKDYGHIIPGHGGVLDRFDSILFTAPGVYIVMYALLTYFY